MILLTSELRERLLANGRLTDMDHVPVVKFFNPLGEGVWLATELDANGDTLFGLADLGEPELGSFVSAKLLAHSKHRRDGTEMVSTINEVDTIDERCLEPFET